MAHNTIQEAIDSLISKKNGDVKKAVYAARIIYNGSKTEFRKNFWKDVIYELRKMDLQKQLDNLNREDC